VQEPDGFRDYVASRSAGLVRLGWLLTGDEAAAQDLVQAALLKAWTRWARIQRQDAPDAYVRRVMMSTFLSWVRRRRWQVEFTSDVVNEAIGANDAYAEADSRLSVRRSLGELPPRQRAVVVLRYFDDLSEAQTARVLGCSVGTVKSQAAKALAKLRQDMKLRSTWEEEVSHEQG
jgi:RNA polymerase sigma-70 factor (sigma-E family)